MNGDDPGPTGTALMVWVVIALLVMAIVLLALLVRGPEDQERSGVPDTVAAATVDGGLQ
jgi:hypothetical protein